MGVAELVEPAAGHAQARLPSLVGAEIADARLPQLDEIVEALTFLEQAFERGDELGVARVERHQLLHVVGGAVRLVRKVLRGLCCVFQQLPLAVFIRLRGQLAIVQAQQVVPMAGRRQHDAQALEGPIGARVELDDA